MSGDFIIRLVRNSLIGLCFSVACVGTVAAEEPADAARVVIDSLHNQLFAVAKESALNFDQRSDKLAPVVGASYDFAYIGRFILRRSWRGLEPAQQEEFVSAFQRLSVASYASRFAEIEEQALVITDVRPSSGERMQVEARLKTEKLDLALAYTLKSDAEKNWTIINVVADGVSDLALRRAEYSRVLKDKGFDGLITHIDDQIADLN